MYRMHVKSGENYAFLSRCSIRVFRVVFNIAGKLIEDLSIMKQLQIL